MGGIEKAIQRQTRGNPKGHQRETKGTPKGLKKEMKSKKLKGNHLKRSTKSKGKPKGNQRETIHEIDIGRATAARTNPRASPGPESSSRQCGRWCREKAIRPILVVLASCSQHVSDTGSTKASFVGDRFATVPHSLISTISLHSISVSLPL